MKKVLIAIIIILAIVLVALEIVAFLNILDMKEALPNIDEMYIIKLFG